MGEAWCLASQYLLDGPSARGLSTRPSDPIALTLQAASHSNKGWETFTAAVLRIVTSRLSPSGGGNGVCFMAWGAHAQKMCAGVDTVSPRCFAARLAKEAEETSRTEVGTSQSAGRDERFLREWAFRKG